MMKLLSRKFILAVIVIAFDIFIALRGSAQIAEIVVGIVMSGIVASAYILGEAIVDAERNK